MASPRLETAKAFLDAFADLSTEKHLSLRTEDCTQIFAPASLGMPPKDNAAFASHLSGLKDFLSSFPAVAKEMIDCAHGNTVTVWATSEAHFHEELKDDGLSLDQWAYRGEYIFILSMDPSGRRIHRIVEFLDSKGTEKLRGLMAKARANRARLTSQPT